MTRPPNFLRSPSESATLLCSSTGGPLPPTTNQLLTFLLLASSPSGPPRPDWSRTQLREATYLPELHDVKRAHRGAQVAWVPSLARSATSSGRSNPRWAEPTSPAEARNAACRKLC